MAHVDDVDKLRTAMMEHAAAFFADVRDPRDVYARFQLCFNTLREEIATANADGLVRPGLAEAWSWYSVAVPAMLHVIFRDPKWGVRQLEHDLNDAFVEYLKGSSTTTIQKPAGTPPGPLGVDSTDDLVIFDKPKPN